MKIDKTKIRELSEGLLRGNAGPSRLSIFNENRSEITYLSVGQLFPYQKQARKIFDQEDIESLAETIREHGIRQPLTVLRVNSNPVHFEVISGERRLRAAKSIGHQKVPCIIIDNAEKAEEIALIENVQRKDLHPIELALSLNALKEKLGQDGKDAIYKKTGLAKTTILDSLRLLDLPIFVRDELLRLNVRNRDILRKMVSLKSEDEQRSYLALLGSKSSSSNAKLKSVMTTSVLRISLREERFLLQKTGISKLTEQQKKGVKDILLEIINEL